ncbi:MAG: succinate dehydrogenase, hydrophobic membrane anchor protein [Pseudomonadota bacterium]
MAYATPISRVRGLGSAKEGVEHFKLIRLTSIASVPLSLWFVWSMVSLSGADYAAISEWLGSTINASLMILLIVSSFVHTKLGAQVIIEDYVRHPGAKAASMVALFLATYAFGTACVVAVLKVALSG